MTSNSEPQGHIDLKIGGTHRLMITNLIKIEHGHVNFTLFLIDLTQNAPMTNMPVCIYTALATSGQMLCGWHTSVKFHRHIDLIQICKIKLFANVFNMLLTMLLLLVIKKTALWKLHYVIKWTAGSTFITKES